MSSSPTGIAASIIDASTSPELLRENIKNLCQSKDAEIERLRGIEAHARACAASIEDNEWPEMVALNKALSSASGIPEHTEKENQK